MTAKRCSPDGVACSERRQILVRIVVCLLLLTCAVALDARRLPHSQDAAKNDKAAGQKSGEQKPAEQKPAAPSMNCPEGQVPTQQMTPFGPMQVCAAGTAAPPPAAPSTSAPAPATPPANAPSEQAKPQPNEPAKPEEKKPEEKAPEAPATAQPPAAQNAGQPSSTPIVQDGAIQLNLENADLYQVLRILAPELKINTIIDPAVKGTVTINTSTTVSRSDLFQLMEMILEINGATAVRQANGYYAIVPIGSAKQQPLDFHFAKKSERQPAPQEGYSLQVFAMKFMPAAEMSKILTPYISGAGQMVVDDKGNLLLISESAAKLAQLREIVDVFDDPVLGRQRVRLIPVHNNVAANLIPELKSIFSGYALSSGNIAVQLLPMERQNAILAISPSPDVFPEVEQWVAKLDAPTETSAGFGNYVYHVQNAKASDLRDIIINLYGGIAPPQQAQQPGGGLGHQQQNPAVNPSNVMGPPNGAAPTPEAQAAAPAAPSAAGGEAVARMQGSVRVMSDDKNNLLIVQASPNDWGVIESTLRQLDVLPRQVLIDARIYEVNLTGDLSVGLSAFLDKKANQTPITTSGSFSSLTGLTAQTFAILHNTYELQLFLTASENRSRVKTLSAPSILVTDNTPARVQVGSEVPVPIGSALTPVQSGGSSVFAQTIQMRDVGVILTVTPRINASGVVTLTIAQEVSSASPNSTSAIVAPIINKSQFETTAILKDGQTLALGGIINTTSNNSRNRVPLIGDIPGVGLLFGNTSLSTTRRELVLLITPHVARDTDDAATISSGFLQGLKDLKKDVRKVTAPAPSGR